MYNSFNLRIEFIKKLNLFFLFFIKKYKVVNKKLVR